MPNPAIRTDYDADLAEAVLDCVRGGMLVVEACAEPGMPRPSDVMRWTREQSGFRLDLQRALEDGSMIRVELITLRARAEDDPEPLKPQTPTEKAARDRIVVSAERLLLSFWNPKAFGRPGAVEMPVLPQSWMMGLGPSRADLGWDDDLDEDGEDDLDALADDAFCRGLLDGPAAILDDELAATDDDAARAEPAAAPPGETAADAAPGPRIIRFSERERAAAAKGSQLPSAEPPEAVPRTASG
jgi:hypothetical protein